MNGDLQVLEAVPMEKIQLNSHFNNFINYLDTSEKTAKNYTRVLRQLFLYFKENNIVQPSRADILKYKEYLMKTKKANTVQMYLTVTRQFFKWLEFQGIYKDITKNIKSVKVSKEHKKDYLTVRQIKEILEAIDKEDKQGLRDFTIISLMSTTALRTIEIARADTTDIRTLGENTVLFVQGKGKTEKNDYVIIPKQIEKLLYSYMKKLNLSTTEQKPLFPSLSNKNRLERLTTRSISRIVKNRFVASGYDSDRLTAHRLRHTAITLALLQNVDIVEVKEFARHSNINTTMIYNHSIEKSKNKCSSVISDVLF